MRGVAASPSARAVLPAGVAVVVADVHVMKGGTHVKLEGYQRFVSRINPGPQSFSRATMTSVDLMMASAG